MDYSFVRKLVKQVSSEEAKHICQALSAQGIEVFAKSEEGYQHVTEEMQIEDTLYVSAADVAYSRDVVKNLGLEHCLCSEADSNVAVEKSEVEKAEEEFYKKHKQNQIFAWIIIAGVVVFLLLQFLNN